jgi:dipeptide/tripeptide permease
LGKFKTITLGFIFYLVGYAIYPILAQNDSYIPNYCLFTGNKSSIEPYVIINNSVISDNSFKNEDLFTEPCSWLLLLADILIGFAVNLIKSNIAPFGAEQVIYE